MAKTCGASHGGVASLASRRLVVVGAGALSSVVGLAPSARAASTAAAGGEEEKVGKKKVVVVGGNGFVGSAVCRAAVASGASVFSISRGGQPKAAQLLQSDWAQEVQWLRGDALAASEWPAEYLEGAHGVVSCVGGFGSHEAMRRVCGTANVRVFERAGAQGVARAAFISAHDYGFPLRNALRGYFEGKAMAEEALFEHFEGGRGAAIRPGMVHGTRYVNLTDTSAVPLPLSVVGKPMEVLFGSGLARGIASKALPGVLQRLAVPAVSADAVGAAAMAAILNPAPSEADAVVDVWQVLRSSP